jgi:ABC-type nitrate/sulfonate/bicarbonate transport system substrate-binding protein
VVSLVVVAGAIVVGVFISQQRPDNITFTVAYEYDLAGAIIGVVKEQSLLEKYLPDNVSVEWTPMDKGSNRRDALATERIAIADIKNTIAIPAIENDYPIMLLANGTRSTIALYAVDPNITSPADLEGKKIASPGAQSIELKSDLARNYNLTLSDDQWLSVGEADSINMLAQNQIDTALLTRTAAEKATVLMPNIRMIRDLTSEREYIGHSGWLMGSTKFFDKHPELLQPVLSAYQEAIDNINDDPKAVSELLEPFLNISAEQIEKELRALPPNIEVSNYDEMAKHLYENGNLDRPAKPFNQLPNHESIPKVQR